MLAKGPESIPNPSYARTVNNEAAEERKAGHTNLEELASLVIIIWTFPIRLFIGWYFFHHLCCWP